MGKAVVEAVQAIPEVAPCPEHAVEIGAWHASAHP
jgi:hypothetical protein